MSRIYHPFLRFRALIVWQSGIPGTNQYVFYGLEGIAPRVCTILSKLLLLLLTVFTFSRLDNWVNVSRLSPSGIDRPTEGP